jgi:hypothetical protein
MGHSKASSIKQEYYFKGIYPVEIVSSVTADGMIEIQVKKRFLHTSNYSTEKHWVKPGETLKVHSKLVWRHRRQTPKGYL